MWKSCHYRWVSASFGSKVSLSDGADLWNKSVSACVWWSCTLPPCVFGQDVVGCYPVFVLVYVSWVFLSLRNTFYFFQEVPSGSGAVCDDASPSAQSIRGASTSSIFSRLVGLPGA